MNILLINHYAGSPKMGMEYRPFYLSREWVRQGHNVYIIAADYSHVRKKNPDIDNDFQTEKIDGVTYVWIKTREYKSNGIGRFLNIIDFNKKLLLNIKKIVSVCNPNLVIASSTYPYDNLVAHKIAKRTGAKHVYEVHDLWPLSPIELYGYSKYHPFIVLTQFFEDYAYKKADKVVSLLPKAKDYMVSRGMNPDKFICIPNGVVKEEWDNYDEELPFEHYTKIENIKGKGKLIIGYAGSHGQANALLNLVQAAKKLSSDKRFHFVLVGDGVLKGDLILESYGLSNITFLPPVVKSCIPQLLANFDICYIGSPDIPLYRFGISFNKLMDCMMAGKPIVFAVKAGNNPVAYAKCGYTIEPDNIELLVSAIKGLSYFNKLDLQELGRKGRKYVVDNFEYKKLSVEFLASVLPESVQSVINIPFAPPRIDQLIIDEVTDTLKSGWITTGPKVKKFEQMLADYCGCKRVLAVNSATAGLEIILRWFGVGEGDEVIVPAYTYTASASVVLHCGAKLILVDVNNDDFNISLQNISNAITNKTKVIMPVDIGGVPCDYDAILNIVQQENLNNLFSPVTPLQKKLGRILILSDSAHSIGAVYKGKRAGSLADISVFSFHAVKNLTTAEGGAIAFNLNDTFDCEKIYTHLNQTILHGQSKDAFAKTKIGSWRYDIMMPGYKMNMTDITASIGIVELIRYQSSTLVKRELLYSRYFENLKKYSWAILREGKNEVMTSSFHLFMLRINNITEEQRNKIIQEISNRGVAVNVHFLPLPMLTAYKDLGFDIQSYPNAYNMYKNEISLPLYFDLTIEQVDYVCNIVVDSVESILKLNTPQLEMISNANEESFINKELIVND